MVHGATVTQDPSLSRLSLTAHYIPESCACGNNKGDVKHVDYREFKGWKYRANTWEYSSRRQMALVARNRINKLFPFVYKAMREFKRRLAG